MSTVTTARRDQRQDPTPSEQRLALLLAELRADFGQTYPPTAIRACAEEVLARYEGMPDHRYVEVVAAREAREALRRG